MKKIYFLNLHLISEIRSI